MDAFTGGEVVNRSVVSFVTNLPSAPTSPPQRYCTSACFLSCTVCKYIANLLTAKWQLTLMKPMSLAYSRKHCRQMLRPYLRISPHWLEQTRLQQTAMCQHTEITKQGRAKPPPRLNSSSFLNLSFCWFRVPCSPI